MIRSELINKVADEYNFLCEHGYGEEADAIVNNHNASEDDSDPNEGFMVTMSESDLIDAFYDMSVIRSKNIEPQTFDDMLAYINRSSDISDDYRDGFLDAAKLLAKQFHLTLNV